MILVYLLGKHGIGKYTVAQEFAKIGYKICDNHLINNPIFSLLDFSKFSKIPDEIWDYTDQIRNIVFDFIKKNPEQNYVLTNVLWNIDYDINTYNKVLRMTEESKTLFIPVKMLINSKDEHLKRIQNTERKLKHKSIKIEDVSHGNVDLIQISHPNLLEIDVTNLQPGGVFERIQRWIYDR